MALPLRQIGDHRAISESLAGRSLGAAAVKYEETKLLTRKWKEITARTFRFVMRRVYEVLGDKAPTNVTTEDVERVWFAVASHSSPQWVEITRVHLRGLFRFLVRHQAIQFDPTIIWDRTEIGVDDHRRVFHDWTVAEIQRWMEHAPPPIYRFVWTACYTGFRRGNIYSMSWGWVSPEWVVEIPASQFKQGRTHRIPLHPRLQYLLEPRGPAQEKVIPGLPSCANRINAILADLATEAGLPVTWSYPHNLRRTFCAWAKAAGVTREQAMDLLGSRSESVLLDHYWPKSPDSEKWGMIDRL